MKTLSIKQPWASLIAHGIKDVENRTWKTNFRGRILIHSTAKGEPDFTFNHEQHLAIPFEFECPYSAIIGEVDIVDCVINHSSIWAEKGKAFNLNGYGHGENYKPIFNWVLENAELYDEPILNVKGKLSFWDFNFPRR